MTSDRTVAHRVRQAGGAAAAGRVARIYQRVTAVRAGGRARTGLGLLRVLSVLVQYASAPESARALSSHALAPARFATR